MLKVHIGRVLPIAALGLAYFAAGKIGLSLAVSHEHITAVWPPAGIALAALLMWGNRLWPGVLLGSFLLNLTTGSEATSARALASIGIAAGSTLQALAGAWLVNRLADGTRAFERSRNVPIFGAMGAAASVIGATAGTFMISSLGLAQWERFWTNWVIWWIGDAAGVMLFAPAVIVGSGWRPRLTRVQALELGIGGAIFFQLAAAVYAGAWLPPTPHLGLAFLCAPPLVYFAFRSGQRGAVTGVMTVTVVAIWGARNGLIFGQLTPEYILIEVVACLAVTAGVVLAIAAETQCRRQRELALEGENAALQQQARLLVNARAFAVDLDGRITSWGAGVKRMYGWSEEEALGQTSAALLRTAYPEAVEQIRATLIRDGQWQGVLVRTAQDGRQVVVASHWVLIQDHGAPVGIVKSDHDVTGQERLRLLAASLMKAQEEERRRLSLQLHDKLNQNLAIVSLDLDRLSQQRQHARHRVALEELKSRVAEISDQLGRTAYELYPSTLDHLGVEVALRSCCASFSGDYGIKIRFRAIDVPASIPDDVAVCLYRVTEECLRNIARHSGSSRALVILAGAPVGLRLIVRDNGNGFDSESVQWSRGLGLLTMSERVRHTGGDFVIRTNPGRGTRIDAQVPVGPILKRTAVRANALSLQ